MSLKQRIRELLDRHDARAKKSFGQNFLVDERVLEKIADLAAEGARTVSYSGVNCKTAGWKDYAFGRDGDRWERVDDPQWREIRDQQMNNHQYTLASEFFCYGGIFSGGPMGDAKSIVRHLKHPATPDARVPARYN